MRGRARRETENPREGSSASSVSSPGIPSPVSRTLHTVHRQPFRIIIFSQTPNTSPLHEEIDILLAFPCTLGKAGKDAMRSRDFMHQRPPPSSRNQNRFFLFDRKFLKLVVLPFCVLRFQTIVAWVLSRNFSVLHCINGYSKCHGIIPTVPCISLSVLCQKLSRSRRIKIGFSPTSTTSTRFIFALPSSSKVERISSTKSRALPNGDKEDPFLIRPALMVDMGRGSKILSDGFFKSKTNFITYQFERLQTYLSLESCFPKPNTNHEIFVACCARRGTVWGMVEVDARTSSASSLRDTPKDGPYMCNLAVDSQYQRMGIAASLVEECERQVREWHQLEQRLLNSAVDDPTIVPVRNSLSLKVRDNNHPAIRLYSKLGYQSVCQEKDETTGEIILLMRKQLSDNLPPTRIAFPLHLRNKM
jgi:ribosomal protein S18 acetylase RimI-like enzyme